MRARLHGAWVKAEQDEGAPAVAVPNGLPDHADFCFETNSLSQHEASTGTVASLNASFSVPTCPSSGVLDPCWCSGSCSPSSEIFVVWPSGTSVGGVKRRAATSRCKCAAPAESPESPWAVLI